MQNKGYTTINTRELYYEWIHPEFKDSTKPVIIFLHEGLGSIQQWKNFPKELCERLQLVGLVYDRHGYGKSEARPFPWSVDFLEIEARFTLTQLIHSFGIDNHIIFGHSDGATISLLYAALQPQNLLCSIVEAPHVILEEISRSGIANVVKLAADHRFIKSMSRYHGEKTADLIKSWTHVWLSEQGIIWEMCQQLSFINTPVCFLQGENDNFGSKQQLNEIENRTQGSFRGIIIPDCGHVPHLESKPFVLEETIDFISGFLKKE
ncbi:MAG: alpha/beta hydrolase [Bacteroidales bacterium]|nr:alpha/beta hydrolase [Bacteroidales bacterium]